LLNLMQDPRQMLRSLAVVFCASLIGASFSPAGAEEDAWGGIRLFEAGLSASNQTIFTESKGEGLVSIRFDISTMTMSWEVQHRGLTSPPTGIHLHGPAQPGTNAVAIIDLGINGMQSPISGAVKVTDSHAQYMLLGWSYVLLKTRQYPEGELRGKLTTVPPAGFKRDGALGR
jgi:hypothetical protein